MAWWALYKWFRPWRKTPYVNMIALYRKKLYDEWFESLSEDEKQQELQRIEDRKIQSRRKVHELLACMSMFQDPRFYR